MQQAGSKGTLERGVASDLWRHTLSQITCVYGRLHYLSSLRNPNTGLYEHHGLALVYGEKEADKALRRSHLRSFEDWLGYSLREQKSDLDAFLSSLPEERGAVIEAWSRIQPYKTVLPAHARATERSLFLADFEVLMELLRVECGVDAPDPAA